jgi:hypothetical protein
MAVERVVAGLLFFEVVDSYLDSVVVIEELLQE